MNKFILMCDCPEVQDNWTPKQGDRFCIVDIWKKLAKEEFYGKIVSVDKFRFACVDDIWLPFQEQIQNKFEEKDPLKLLSDFYMYCFESYALGVMAHPRQVKEAKFFEDYISQFTSMDQLWLTFYMNEKHNKELVGDKWILKKSDNM